MVRQPRFPRFPRFLGPILATGFLLLFGVALLRWHEAPPSVSGDVCTLLMDKSGWYRSVRRSEKRWKVPVAVQLAILFQESSFRAGARPPRRMLWGVIPWRRPSSAYGYAQALDGTWRDYQRRVAGPRASRRHFPDVSDFVGWYGREIHQRAGIETSDAYNLYLAYHEGPAGYARGSHLAKPWLLKVAEKVAARAALYDRQLEACDGQLQRRSIYRRAFTGIAALLAVTLVVYAWGRRAPESRRRKRTSNKRGH